MIGVLKVIDGYAAKLKRLQSPVEFKPGLNILFGPNGCGKSTTLKIAAAYCGIKEAGWSKIQEPGLKKFPNFHELSPGKCKAELEWDGTPSLLADSSVSDQTQFAYFYDEKKDSPDGLTDMKDQLGVMFSKPSSGMLRMSKLKQYADALKNPPNLTVVPKAWKNYNSTWTNWAKKQNEYYASLSPTGMVTFMLDEPERSFSIENQMQFWTLLVPRWAIQHQVVIATHCPFALLHVEDARWIDFDPEYRTKSLEALKSLKPIM